MPRALCCWYYEAYPLRTHLIVADALTKSLPGPVLTQHRVILFSVILFSSLVFFTNLGSPRGQLESARAKSSQELAAATEAEAELDRQIETLSQQLRDAHADRSESQRNRKLTEAIEKVCTSSIFF